MNVRRTLPLLLALAVAPAPAVADIHPNLQRGLDAAKSLQVGDVDHVNLMNGSLNVTIPIGSRYPVDGNLSYGLVLVQNSNVWDFVEVESNGTTYNSAIPSHFNNSGLGWMLTLGRLEISFDSGAWTYTGPDGSEHTFYDRLHDDETPTTGVWYSRDGSYLRMTELAGGNQVEFPSGEIHEFWKTGVAQGELKRAFDRFGNFVKMTPSLDGLTWELEDGHGRLQRIYFAADGFLGKRVTSVELTAFGGATATYAFGYTAQSVHRPCPNTWGQTSGPVIVNLLTSVTLFDGSSYAMPSYHLDQSAGCRTPGSLRKLVLPTLGAISWTYQAYNLPAPPGRKVWRQLSNGVASRTLTDAAGTVAGTWQYATTLLESSPPFRQLRNTVTTPLGHKTENFFSVSLEDSGGWTVYEYGLPLTHSASSGARFLSTRTYAAGNSDPLRETYVLYERDEGFGTAGDPTSTGRFNQRVVSTRTLYKDDDNRVADVDSSDFDGPGHYRTTETGGNFASGNVRVSYTNYNPNRGSYPGDFTMLTPGERWLLETFDQQDETEGAQTARRTFDFEDDTGWLRRVRTHLGDNGVVDTKDLIVERVRFIDGNPPTSHGNLESERHYGGDTQAVATGELATLTLPAAPTYRIDHTTHYGTRSVSQYMTAGGTGIGFKTLDCGDDPTTVGVNDPGVDPSTGLRAKCRDTAGVATTFDYDKLGRTKWTMPGAGESWTELVYTRATGSNALAKINVYSHPNGGGLPLVAESLIQLDAFGRLWREQLKMADSSMSTRETRYDGMGWKKSVSQLGNVNKLTAYADYDPFGRPGTVTAPDGSEVAFTYKGVSSTSRSVSIGDTVGEAHLAFTKETYDRQGRLSQVKEEAETDPAAPSLNTTTDYFYDVGNRLARSRQQTFSSGTQNRYFVYDQRGFLLREEHPEKGTSSGNGKVFYTGYDARGHAERRFECTSAVQACLDTVSLRSFQVKFTYDRAERLLSVTDETVAPTRPLKTFVYGTSELPNERTNGRLLTASRYNYQFVGIALFTRKVDETYAYAGPGGRTSSRTTQLVGWDSISPTPVQLEGFSQSWTYDDLGNTKTIGYPDCTTGSCANLDSARTVTNAYTNGWLTAVTGNGGASYASGIAYHPNGMLKSISRSNGVKLSVGPDPNSMSRPAYFFTTGAGSSNWSSGTYFYDGAGNVTFIGSSKFTYDHVSRLKTADVYVEPQTGLPFSDSFESGDFTCWAPGSCLGASLAASQTFTYDPFGNLKQVVGTNGRTMPTNSSTNRLTSATYDVMGNVLTWNGDTYEYDALGMMTRRCPSDCGTGLPDYRYLYTADDERLFFIQVQQGGGVGNFWTLRDLDGSTLRQYDVDTGWSTRDYIYREGQLLASNASGEGDRHFHLDHLGTPRLVTNAAAAKVAYHAYLPFGEEATAAAQDVERRKFTGHERDTLGTSDVADDRDNMHARNYNPLIARFASFDPVMQTGRAKSKPQLWNRYAYALDNPLTFVDPTGEDVSIGVSFAGLSEQQKAELLKLIKKYFESLKVGQVYIFDAAKFNEANSSLFGLRTSPGVAAITIDGSQSSMVAKPELVPAGAILADKSLSSAQQLQAIANVASHELLAHQLGAIDPDIASIDAFAFARGSAFLSGQAGVQERYGTIADHEALVNPAFRETTINGPLPIHAADLARAQRLYQPVQLNAPTSQH